MQQASDSLRARRLARLSPGFYSVQAVMIRSPDKMRTWSYSAPPASNELAFTPISNQFFVCCDVIWSNQNPVYFDMHNFQVTSVL